MSRNIEDIFGGVAVSSRPTSDIYTAKGGETVVTAQHDFVNATLTIDGAVQTPGEAYYIDGRDFNLAQPLNPGSKVQMLLNTAWSTKEVQGQYTQVVQFRSVGGETSYTPNFSFSSALLFLADRPLTPGIDYTIQNGKIVYTSQLPADKQAYFIFNGGKGDLAFYKKLDEANADKSEILERILKVYPVNFPVSSEAAMLALDAKPGDNATRSDQNRVYYLTANPASNLSNWKPFVELNQSVVTVNGRVGDVIVAEKGANNDITSLGALSGPLRLGGDAVNQYDAVTLKQLLAAGGGTGANMTGVMTNFLGAVEWFNGSRAKLPAGYVAADGQLLNRAENADLWNAVNSGMFVSVDDTTWLNASGSKYVHRGKYSTGNGSTTFRVPDLNGQTTGSIIPFLRGDGSGGSVGVVYESGAPNITGASSAVISSGYENNMEGAMYAATDAPTITRLYDGGSNFNYRTRFDASRSNAVYGRANEVRPQSVIGIWIIRVNSKFSAAGTAFNVISADNALPSSGTVVYGGDVRSNYQVAGADKVTARFRGKYIVGGAKVVDIQVIDSTGSSTVEGTPVKVTSDGHLILQSNKSISYATSGTPDVPIGMLGYTSGDNKVTVGNTYSNLSLQSGNSFQFNNAATFTGDSVAVTRNLFSNNTYYGGILSSNVSINAALYSWSYFQYNNSTGGSHFVNVVNNGSQWAWAFNQGGNAVAPGSWVGGSDERHKTNIKTVENAMAAVLSWNGSTYDKKDGESEVGLIAQQVEKACSVAVSTFGDRKFKDGTVIPDFKNLNTAGVAAAFHTEALKTLFTLVEMLAEDKPEILKIVKEIKQKSDEISKVEIENKQPWKEEPSRIGPPPPNHESTDSAGEAEDSE